MNDINSIYQNMHQQLSTFIRQRVKDKEEVKDILQDVFVKIQKNLPKLKRKEKLTPWVFQIAQNTIYDYYRRQKKNIEEGNRIEDIPFSSSTESENLHQQFSKSVLSMINTLPEKYKTALYLTEIEGLSQKELAERLNISYSGAKSRVQRGKEKLKILFLQCCDIETDKYGNIIDYRTKKCDEDKC